ncbi:class C beta-lactamase [Pseudomonas endophytica]|uniref:Beta-lactamase n=1 Tax=Pseudomonas endophytica TaxID=1563157 RepID=A0A0Q0YVN8_9PSED|nr:class C beta-lactamase [Pseudomonas endophytica]KQB53311.1 class C beta-lactamase [Pseudomonas endophytica]
MRSLRKLSALTASALVLCAQAGLSHAEAFSADIEDSVQKAAKTVMQQYAIPGLVIAISNNGKQQFYSFGLASKATEARVTPDTLFEVGSISKLFTATLASYAQVEGLLSFADPVSKFLPSLQGSAFGKVALLHLATHTGGGFPLQVPENVKDDQQLLSYLNAWQPTYPAGTHRSYANPSIGMLGVIAAKSLNLSFTAAMQNTLYPALGLHSTYLNVPQDKMPLYAQGYNKTEQPVRLNPDVLADQAYGVRTSARDLIHFAQLNLQSGKAESVIERAVLNTHTGYFQIGPMTQDLVWEQYPYPVTLENLLEGNSNTMAYETHQATALNPPLAPQKAVWLNKTGSTSGFGGYIAVLPEKQQAVVILANKNYPNSARVELAYAIFKALH